MKAKNKIILQIIFCYFQMAVLIIGVGYQFFYWFNNPQLTRMEVFLNTWWCVLIPLTICLPTVYKYNKS